MLFWLLLAFAIVATGAVAQCALDRKPLWTSAWFALATSSWSALCFIGAGAGT